MKSIDEIGSLSNNLPILDICQMRKEVIDRIDVRRSRTRLARPLLNHVILRIIRLLDADSISKLRLNDQRDTVQSISTLGSVESRYLANDSLNSIVLRECGRRDRTIVFYIISARIIKRALINRSR